MEFDHLFIRTHVDAPAAQMLCDLGLSEGSGNRHPGQGTANRRFFFHNGYIEFIWISDQEEVSSPTTQPTQLARRLDTAADGVSPFGVCFRSSSGQTQPSFASVAYRPAYLPTGCQIELARHAPLSEPMWFFFAHAVAPAQLDESRRQPLQHALGLREITHLSMTVATQAPWSDAAQAAMKAGIELKQGDCHLLELSFDHAQRGQQIDLRPALPLLIRL